MRQRAVGIAVACTLASVFAAGCPPDAQNPSTLWLYLDGRETEVKLVPYEPEPF